MILSPGDITILNFKINIKNNYNEDINIPVELIENVISNLIYYYTGIKEETKLNHTYFERKIFKEKFTTKNIK